ncbi:MAG: LpqB family beta-propeller domain-containing protein [Micromonosporaceae bacterium]
MIRFRGSAVAVVLAASLVGVAGCGVPDSGAPVVDSTPRPVLGPDDDTKAAVPVAPEDASNSQEAVTNYFHAASTEWSGLQAQVKRFTVSGAPPPAARPNHIAVIRLSEISDPVIVDPAHHRIAVAGTRAGNLTEAGLLLPQTGRFTHTFQLRLVDNVWLIENPPAGYVLSVAALSDRYEVLPLYFTNHWNVASLVPDVRYLPLAMDWGKQRSVLVDRLLQGPAPWLTSVAARGFPAGTKRNGSVYVTKAGVTVVNLTSEANGYDRKDLMLAQLLWTLRLRLNGELQMRIEDRPISVRGHTTHAVSSAQGLNAVANLPQDDRAYYIDDAARLAPLSEQGLPSVLCSDQAPDRRCKVGSESQAARVYNLGVEAATASWSGDLVALLRRTAEGPGLVVGQLKRRSDGPPAILFQSVAGLPSAGAIGRPVWVGTSARRWMLFAAADGLYEVNLQRLRARRIAVPGLTTVQAVSVAPDGFRIALVSHGRLYVAELPVQAAGLAVESVRLVTDQLTDAVDVAWSSERHLAAAARSGLREVSIDGVELEKLPTLTGGPVDHVAAYPKVTGQGSLSSTPHGRVLFTQGGRVYQAFSNSAGQPAPLKTAPDGAIPFFAF